MPIIYQKNRLSLLRYKKLIDMKAKISEQERQVLISAYHILESLERKMWNEHCEDCVSDGILSYYFDTNKVARCTSNVVNNMFQLFRLLKIYPS